MNTDDITLMALYIQIIIQCRSTPTKNWAYNKSTENFTTILTVQIFDVYQGNKKLYQRFSENFFLKLKLDWYCPAYSQKYLMTLLWLNNITKVISVIISY